MKAVLVSDPGKPGKQIVEETKKTTTEIPTSPKSDKTEPQSRMSRTKAEHINTWFSRIPPDERSQDWVYTLYRDDSRIIIVDENLDDRASGRMLYKFLPDEIKALPEGPFLQEMGTLVQERFGGGDFHLMVNSKKYGTMKYNKALPLAGEPKLSPREGWKDGQSPASGGVPDQWAVRTLIEFIDKKLDSVNAGKQDPGAAYSQITQAVMDSNSKALGFILANMPKAADPIQQLDQMKTLLQVMREMQPSAPVAPSAPPVSPIQQLRDVMELEKLMRERESGQTVLTPQTITTAVTEGFKQIGGISKRVSGWVEFGQALAPFAPVLAPLVSELTRFIRDRPTAGQPGAPASGIRIVARGGPAGQQPQQPGGSAQAPAGGMYAGGSAGGMPVGAAHGGAGQAPLAQTPPNGQPAAPQAAQQPVTPQEGQWVIPQQAVDDLLWNRACERVVDMLLHNREGSEAAAALDDMFPEIAAQIEQMSFIDLQKMLADDPILGRVKTHPRALQFATSFYQFFHQPAEPEPEVEKVQ